MTHLAAFHCAKCPRNNNPKVGPSCPVWWETVWNNASGETKVIKSCGWEQLPLYLTEVIKASNRPAAAIESTRNEISSGFGRLIQSVQATNLLPRAYAYELQSPGTQTAVSGPNEGTAADGRGE